MCKFADVQICKCLRSIDLQNLHICTSANLHIPHLVLFSSNNSCPLCVELFSQYSWNAFIGGTRLPSIISSSPSPSTSAASMVSHLPSSNSLIVEALN